MADDRRMTTDRFYGGVSNRLQNLRSMLEYVRTENPSRSQLNQWVISNTRANSEEAVSHHLTFLESVELIELSEQGCELAEYGERWLDDQSSETLYEALSSGVKGFDTLLQALQEGAMTDEEIMELLVSEFEEAEMTKPGPAIRHREWLQVLRYVEREGEVNRLTPKGRDLIEDKHSEIETNTQPVSPDDISVGDKLSQEEIETAFDTGFGYRISGINPRRDEQDNRYILLFANEEGPYDDSVTQGQFEYIGEGLSGDQSENSPGNSALIDAQMSDIPIHFFYKRAEGKDWEYQGLVDVVDYELREQGGREVLVFAIEHQQHSEEVRDIKGNDAPQLAEKPDSGETFTAEIDRISSAGNGIIETKEGHINIGPVTRGAVGAEITAKMDSSTFARCMTKDVRVDDYKTQYGLLKTPANQSSASNPLPPIDERTTTYIGGSTFCSQCGSLMYPSGGGSRVCSSCGHKESDITTNEDETETDSDTTDESSGKVNDGVSAKEDAPTKPSESPKNRSSSEQAETTSIDLDSSTDTSELRKKAVESAVEEVPEEASTVQHEAPTYNRSQAVKEYVKARAGGVCEGCGEPAPFTSKTGEPYLHAHHIHELSDGGSDTPDTVVGLCPNCHYRVHHGDDGDEYNQELLEIVQEKENSNE